MTTDLTDAEIAAIESEPIDVDRLRAALSGGYLAATVRAKSSGRHVSFTLACKKREGGRVISRQTRDGRVGLADADVVYVDAEGEYVARLEIRDANWLVARNADANVVWAAKAVMRWAEGSLDLTEQADVLLRAFCSRCHRGLRHPESIAELIGPECSGKRRKGRRAERVAVTAQAPVASVLAEHPCPLCGGTTHAADCPRAQFGF